MEDLAGVCLAHPAPQIGLEHFSVCVGLDDFYSSTDLWGKGRVEKKQCELSSHLPAIIYPDKSSNTSSSTGNRNT